jgi:hypothetical protein
MENIKKITWQEAVQHLIKFNIEHGITAKGEKPATCTMVAVIAPESFTKEYSLESRSYIFSNHNKYFIPENGGMSIFASSLAGDDPCIRLEQYVPHSWKVDYCYIKETWEE